MSKQFISQMQIVIASTLKARTTRLSLNSRSSKCGHNLTYKRPIHRSRPNLNKIYFNRRTQTEWRQPKLSCFNTVSLGLPWRKTRISSCGTMSNRMLSARSSSCTAALRSTSSFGSVHRALWPKKRQILATIRPWRGWQMITHRPTLPRLRSTRFARTLK